MSKLVKPLVTALVLLQLSGCAVIAVADLAATAAVGAAGMAVDATIGAAKVGGKVIGKTADVILGGEKKD